MIAAFELEGQRFTALNGGPHFKFTEAVSFVVNCETQEEVDHFWDKLGEGGQIQQCGWLKDKFGLSWQIVPTVLPELMSDADPEKVSKGHRGDAADDQRSTSRSSGRRTRAKPDPGRLSPDRDTRNIPIHRPPATRA